MSNIKTKDIKSKSIKSLDKVAAWTKRVKDPIVYANEKSEETVSSDTNIIDYGLDKMKYESNRMKDEATYMGKMRFIRLKNKIINDYKNKSNKKIGERNVFKGIKTTETLTSEEIKFFDNNTNNLKKRVMEQGKKLAIKAAKKIPIGTKKIKKVSVSAIKGILVACKSLVTLLIAGGSVLSIPIIVICLIGLLITSMFGIFFSSDSSNSIKMSDCIEELNKDLDNKIVSLEKSIIHDEVVIEADVANWKDILSLYAVRLSNGNEEEVMTIDIEKKKILKEVFWDMNSITSEVKHEKYIKKTIDSRDDLELRSEHSSITSSNFNKKDELIVDKETEEIVRVLHIYVNKKDPKKLIEKYKFNEIQKKQYEELNSEKYDSMWSSAIYGVYGSSGAITEWKQHGKEWSKIRIGRSSKTINNAGCLVTSIAILIKKSGVSTKNIYPFNPGTFVTALNNVYGFDGANLQYNSISKVVPDFVYQGRVNLTGMSKKEKYDKIKKYYENGYYLTAEVLGATRHSQHWVAIDNVVGGQILMLDSGSNETNMWDEYDWNKTTQFVYFKVSKKG